MQQAPPQPPTLREFDFEYYISHYTQLLWRWRMWIVIAAPVALLAFCFYYYNFGRSKPILEASVMIGLEGADSKSAVADLGETAQLSRLALIKAKGFLSDIVIKHNLRLQVKDFSLHEVFDSISVDSSAPGARYRLTVKDNSFQIHLWSQPLGAKEKLIESGSLSNLNTLLLSGMYCRFSPSYLKKPFNVEWSIMRQRDAIGWLLANLTVYDKKLEQSYGSEKENFVGVSLKGRDYHRITRVINSLADEFVEKSRGFKKRKTNEAISVLERQLQTASEQVAVTQDAVRQYRSAHPNVALASELQSSISNMALLETSMYTSRSSAEEAQRINTQLTGSSEADQELLINEALLFLSRQGAISASVLGTEFNILLQQKTALSVGYAKNHPQVIENRSKIADIKAKTQSLLVDYVKSSTTQTYQQSNKIQEITSRMQGLPVQQQQLAELERKAQIAAEIHSSILTRFNQAKISDAVEMPDVYIMDYAIEPEGWSSSIDKLKYLGIGLALILVMSFGPPVVFDLFDKTARTESELLKFLPYTFFESIPVISAGTASVRSKKKPASEAPKTTLRLIDPKLVTASYTPDFTNEIFRSFRSKIMLRSHDVEKKRLLITSLGPNEGKSLISANLAITMAQQKLKTLLIDGDIRRGVQHNTFALQKKPGLADFLFSESVVDPQTITPLLQTTHVPNLSLIASGPNVPNPSELLGLPRLEQLIDYLSGLFDVLILDTPPLGVSVDAAIISKLFTGTIIVVKAGQTNTIALKKRLKEFPNLQQKILGLILNQAALDASMKKYKYYAYNY